MSLWSAGLFMAEDGETVSTKREKGHPFGREYNLQTAGGRGKQQIHERTPTAPPLKAWIRSPGIIA
jgi:hypothetical protein